MSKNLIMDLADGNMEALDFLMILPFKAKPIELAEIIMRIQSVGIKGTQIYVMYNEICERDIQKVIKLCNSDCPNDLLIDACNRHDYTRREILKKYL